MIDYLDLLGVEFQYGGRGPAVYDCYGLVMECERRSTGREIPDYRSPKALEEIASKMAGEKYRWICVAKKEEGVPIPFSAMQPGRALEIRVRGYACHVGFIHKPRKFLHTWEGTGGVTQEDIELWRARILGVYEYGG
jgi:cell wall-associated NlpC family hydrolase